MSLFSSLLTFCSNTVSIDDTRSALIAKACSLSRGGDECVRALTWTGEVHRLVRDGNKCRLRRMDTRLPTDVETVGRLLPAVDTDDADNVQTVPMAAVALRLDNHRTLHGTLQLAINQRDGSEWNILAQAHDDKIVAMCRMGGTDFATIGRDQFVKVWRLTEETVHLVSFAQYG